MKIELAEDDKTTPKAGPVPREALKYFKRKGLKVSFDYRDVWQQEHNLAFTVSKVAELGILKTVRHSIEKAIEEGQTLEEWKKTAAPMLEESGWRSHVSDNALPSRLKVIYETNMRMARANGQADRIQRTKAVLPYIVYELGPSKEHRAEHAAWNGLTLPVDDAFWATHYPPLAFGCRCRVRQVSRTEADKDGGPDTAPVEEQVPYELPDGRSGFAPAGVDPAFAYPKGTAGRERSINDALKSATETDKEQASMDESAAIAVVAKHLAASGVKLEDLVVAWPGQMPPGHIATSPGGKNWLTPEQNAKKLAESIAHSLSDGARRALAELVAMCPTIFDTTGVSKFTSSDEKTARKYIDGELATAGLVGRRESQNRLGLFPTTLARTVQKLLTGAL